MLALTSIAAAEDAVRGQLVVEEGQARVEATIAPGWHVNAHLPRDGFLVPTTLTLEPPPGVEAGEVVYPEPVERELAFAGGRRAVLYEGTLRMTAPLVGNAAAGAAPFRAQLRYQACDATRCLPPRTLTLVAATAGEGRSGTLADNAVARVVGRWGYIPTLFVVAALGLALNLTPCVYPLISVTVAFFGGRTGAPAGAALGRALVYGLGICLSFAALGVSAAMTGSLFGSALQRPAVLGGIAVVLLVLAASNFGLYTLSVPAPIMRRLGRTGEGVLGAFVMGLTMGLVAAPCIGPIVLALVLFVGSQQSALIGFALFFALGVGMGAPYVGLAALAGRLRRLPPGGAWLIGVERIFGFILVGVALWFAAPLLPTWLVRAAAAAVVLAASTLLGFVGTRGRGLFVVTRRLGGLALAAVALLTVFRTEATSPIPWIAYSEDALAHAIAEGRPVLIDFEAAWCLPCREMERTTFRDPAVVRAVAAFATLKVDLTEEDDPTAALRERFAIAGVPTYVLLGPDGTERRRLVGFISPRDMLAALGAIDGAGHG
ncbi:MAG TPA: cytochrome c biogenesis protein CcdA [Candidatus Nitrosopolaris sp.]|nr:cytochrome c biogenesis protein CcdA [Candidatus Nitrosopolaris sp.]